MKKVFLILVILLCITTCDESSIGAIAKNNLVKWR